MPVRMIQQQSDVVKPSSSSGDLLWPAPRLMTRDELDSVEHYVRREARIDARIYYDELEAELSLDDLAEVAIHVAQIRAIGCAFPALESQRRVLTWLYVETLMTAVGTP